MKILGNDVTWTSRTFSGNGGNAATTSGDNAVLIGAAGDRCRRFVDPDRRP
jgi:hypothetical protein